MKIGDLVRLSAYGRQRRRAEWIDRTDVGLITSVLTYTSSMGSCPDDYVIHWTRSKWCRRRSWGYERSNTRKDLMYVK